MLGKLRRDNKVVRLKLFNLWTEEEWEWEWVSLTNLSFNVCGEVGYASTTSGLTLGRRPKNSTLIWVQFQSRSLSSREGPNQTRTIIRILNRPKSPTPPSSSSSCRLDLGIWWLLRD